MILYKYYCKRSFENNSAAESVLPVYRRCYQMACSLAERLETNLV